MDGHEASSLLFEQIVPKWLSLDGNGAGSMLAIQLSDVLYQRTVFAFCRDGKCAYSQLSLMPNITPQQDTAPHLSAYIPYLASQKQSPPNQTAPEPTNHIPLASNEADKNDLSQSYRRILEFLLAARHGTGNFR
jgi:hypothetical protein